MPEAETTGDAALERLSRLFRSIPAPPQPAHGGRTLRPILAALAVTLLTFGVSLSAQLAAERAGARAQRSRERLDAAAGLCRTAHGAESARRAYLACRAESCRVRAERLAGETRTRAADLRAASADDAAETLARVESLTAAAGGVADAVDDTFKTIDAGRFLLAQNALRDMEGRWPDDALAFEGNSLHFVEWVRLRRLERQREWFSRAAFLSATVGLLTLFAVLVVAAASKADRS